MTISIDGHSKRIGLALSGGGFRAAAFHLGVFRALQEARLLAKIDVVSCVSGGSIAGAAVALRWNQPDALDRLEEYLTTKSIAVAAVLGGALDPFQTRLEKLAGSYDKDLFKGKSLSALRGGPRIYLNSTNLSTGNMFFFVAGGGLDEEMGEHELGVVPAKNFPIARAVAASSAFPPVFPPLRLTEIEYPPASSVQYVTLTDGGVYDNMGVNPLLRERNALDYIIVSDGGKPFKLNETPTESGAIVLKESINIMMEQIRGLEFDRIEHRFKARTGPKPLWFSIDGTEGETVLGDAAAASGIDTNLKRLTTDEMGILTRHGASLVKARISKYAPELLA